MTSPAIEVDGPHHKWEITMALTRQSALSREAVRFYVRADQAGLPFDPSGGTVEAAFLTSSRGEPGAGDWKAASWDTSLIGSHVAECVVGPGGTVQLAKGRYYCWLRITIPGGDQVVRQAGMLFID